MVTTTISIKKVPTMFRIVGLVCLMGLVALPSLTGAIIFNRPFITVAPGETTWTPAGNYILGDDFTLASSATIDSISVWMVADNTITTNPNQELSSIRLFAGPDPGPLTLLSSSYSFTAEGTYANPNLHINQPIFMLTFSGLNFAATGGTLYDFGVEGTSSGSPFNLAAVNPLNATTPGPGDGADGLILAFTGTHGTGPYNFSFTTPSDPNAALVGDINVQITTTVPEPATFGLLGLGAVVMLAWRQRQRLS